MRRLWLNLALSFLVLLLPTSAVMAIPGDFNLDGTVDLIDLDTFDAAYRTNNDSCDLDEYNDGDTFVNVVDAAVFAYHYGRAEADAAITAITPIAVGDPLPLTITDADEHELIHAQDTVVVVVTNLATGETETVILAETGLRTGIFTVTGGLTTSGNSADSVSSSGTLYLTPDDSGTVYYIDNDWAADTDLIYFNVASGTVAETDGSFESPEDIWYAGFPLTVFINDPDQNQDPTEAETVPFVATNLSTGETETYIAIEDGPNSDTFSGDFITSSDTADSISSSGTMWIQSNDSVEITYTDPDDPSDSSSDSVTFVPQNSASITLQALVIAGDNILCEVDDSDENEDDGTAETVTVTVMNGNTGETETFVLTETGNATGIFDTGIPTSVNASDSVSGNGILYTAPSDSVLAYYVDNDCPPDSDSVMVFINSQRLPDFVAALRVTVSRDTGTVYAVTPVSATSDIITVWVDAIDSDGTIVNNQMLEHLVSINYNFVPIEIRIDGAAVGWNVLTSDTVISNPFGCQFTIADTQAEALTISCSTTGFENDVYTNQNTDGHINFVEPGTIYGDFYRDIVGPIDPSIVSFIKAVDPMTGKRISSTGSIYRLNHTAGDNFTIRRLLPGTYDLHIEPLSPLLEPEYNSEVGINLPNVGDDIDANDQILATYADRGSLMGDIFVQPGGITPAAAGIDEMVAYLSWDDTTLPNSTLASFDAGDAITGYGSINDFSFPAEVAVIGDIASNLEATADSTYYINILGLDVDGYKLYMSDPIPAQVIDGLDRQVDINLQQVMLTQFITFNNSMASYDSTNVAPVYQWQFWEFDPDDYFFTIEVTDRADSILWKVTGIPEATTQMTYGNVTAGTEVIGAQPLEQNQVYKWTVRAGLTHNPQVGVQNFIYSYNGYTPDTTIMQGSFSADSFTDFMDDVDGGIAALQAMTEDALTELSQMDPEELLEYEPTDNTGQPLTVGAYFVTRQRIVP